MPTRNVNLTEYFDRFIETRVTSGRFSNASEVVREGLRLLEQREQEDKAKLEWLRAAAKEGFDQLDRGEGIEFESMESQIQTGTDPDLQHLALRLRNPGFPQAARLPIAHREIDNAREDVFGIQAHSSPSRLRV